MRILAALVALALSVAAPGCSENQPSGFTEFVQKPSSQPKFVTPAPGSTGVSPVPEIHVGYEAALNYATAKADVIQLFDLGPTLTTPTRVAVAILGSEDGRGFDVIPTSQLAAPRTFEVRILGRTTGLRFLDGSDIDDATLRFTTAGDPAFTTPAGALAAGQNGVGYGPVQLTTTGGAPPLGFAITEGTLPGGLTLELAIGRIVGAPTISSPTPQTFQFTVTVSDAIGRSGSRTFSITVDP